MPFLLDNQPAGGAVWRTIQLDGYEPFEIEIRRPTFDDLCADSDTRGSVTRNRVLKHVVGWRGIERVTYDTTQKPETGQTAEKCKPLPFSVDDLQRLCGLYPAVFVQIANAVQRVFWGLNEDERKN